MINNGFYVTQERTIEVYEKWKKIKKLNDRLPKENKIKIVGIELIRNYKFVSKHIVELLKDEQEELVAVKEIKNMVALDTTNYALGDLSFAYKIMQNFVKDYESNKLVYQSKVKDVKELDYIIKTIKLSFNGNPDRLQIMFDNYLDLDAIYDFRNNPHYIRIGFSHLKKSKEGENGRSYLFTRFIENNIYKRENVLSVIGYFTDSEVVWDELYEDGKYVGFTTEAGYGIGDYDKEYFRGIQNLKT